MKMLFKKKGEINPNKVIRRELEHIGRIDIYYYCPHCNKMLIDEVYFGHKFPEKCPYCKEDLYWG